MANEDVLSDIEKDVLRIKLAEPGISNTEIARRVGRSRQWVVYLMQTGPLRDLINEALDEAVEAARTVLLMGSQKAAQKLVDLIDHGDSDHTQRLAALNVLQILQRRGESGDIGDEEWESVIGQSGAVKTERVRRQIEAGEDEDPDAN